MAVSRFTRATWSETGRMKNGRPLYVLTSPLVYELGHLGSGWKISAEEGFETDLASLPAWLARTSWGRKLARIVAKSSVVHDCMRKNVQCPKLLGDYAFFEAMGVERVSLWLRILCFVAVLINFNRS